MNNIELNHLKYFYYTVLEGGVSQAANRLHVQQPVVSKMLKTLESDLGQTLFWKKGRNKTLTDYGQLVFRHCQVVFDEVNKLKNLSENLSKISGLFNIGGSEPIVNHLFYPVLEKLSEEFPNINMNVYATTQKHLLDMVSDGRLELGCFFYALNIPKDLEIIKTIPYPFRLVIKKTHITDKNVIQSFIGSREIDDTSTHSFPTLNLIREKYPDARITFSSNSLSLHKALVLKGKGVAILPEFLIQKEIKKGTLVDLFPKKRFHWDLMILKRKSTYLSIPAQSFLELWEKANSKT